MPRVLRSTQAYRDLVDIWTCVAEKSPAAADALLEMLDQKCKMLADHPQIGRSRQELGPHLRSFPGGSYLIFYRPLEDGIEVVRVLHGSMDLAPSLFNQEN